MQFKNQLNVGRLVLLKHFKIKAKQLHTINIKKTNKIL